MDPTATLYRIRELLQWLEARDASYEAYEGYDWDWDRDRELAKNVDDLTPHVTALDEWMSRDGFPPEQWSKKA